MSSVVKRPRPHQLEAIEAVQATLADQDRASVLMACGTGKTLVGRWLAERRRARVTLVLVPSLALVAQTLREWRGAGGAWQFEALIICSDRSTADGERERVGSDGADVPVPFWARHRAKVTLSASDAAAQLHGRQDSRPMVVFCTYHSVAVAAAAAREAGVSFELVIADEAHHLAGHPRAEFRQVLAADFPAAATVFMTATQVLAAPAPSRPGWDDWQAPVSMGDESLFGPVAYRLDFATAITHQLLSDYQVLIYEARGDVTPDPCSALLAAATQGLSRVLTFHGRVAKAEAFAAAVDGLRLQDGRRVRAVAVSGADPAIRRADALQILESPDPGTLTVVASARCLAEGVDVPAVDAVMFADPRASDVGIIQAVGRALRRAPGKTVGTVLLPVCYDADLDEDTTLSTSSFAAAWRILRGLRTVDSRLAAELEQVSATPSRRGVADGSRTPGPLVRFDIPSADDLQSLAARLVQNTTTGWDQWFARLETFVVEHGHVTPTAPQDRPLANWCERQRQAHRVGMLLPDRAAALRALPGWVWDEQMRVWLEQWKEVYAAARRCAGGRLDLEDAEVMSRRLRTRSQSKDRATTVGRWCALQRILLRRGDLDGDRTSKVRSIPGWVDQAIGEVDAACVDLLGEHVAWKGEANVPADYVDDDMPVGRWLMEVRRRRVLGSLSQALLDELEVLTPSDGDGKLRWETRQARWQIGLGALRQYVAREGRCRIPEHHVETFEGEQFPLYVWCRRARHLHRHGRLDPGRVADLEAVPGWLWEIQPTARIRIAIGDTRHGTRTGYVKGCRCTPCTEANRHDHAARVERAQQGGASTDLVSAARATGHLRILEGQGATQKAMARAAGLNTKTIVDLLNGTRERILPDTEKTVLALTLEDAQRAAVPGSRIPAGPTWELIEDLLERGWPKRWIAQEAGMGASLQLSRDLVNAASAQRIAELHARVGNRTAPPRRPRRPVPPLAELVDQQQPA